MALKESPPRATERGRAKRPRKTLKPKSRNGPRGLMPDLRKGGANDRRESALDLPVPSRAGKGPLCYNSTALSKAFPSMHKIFDVTAPLSSALPLYAGDPPVRVERSQRIADGAL